MTDLMLDILSAQGPIIPDGPFATNDVYVAALAALRPASPILPSADTEGTSLGAAMLVDPDTPVEMPTPAALPGVDISSYCAHWRTLAGARRLLAADTQFFN